MGEGGRAKGLESPEVASLKAGNERARREEQRLKAKLERTNGTGSAKALALQDENNRVKNETQRLREIDDKRTREETQAFNWLRTATAYLATGKIEDQESAKARLKVVLERYPNSKAAEKAAEMLSQLTHRTESSVTGTR